MESQRLFCECPEKNISQYGISLRNGISFCNNCERKIAVEEEQIQETVLTGSKETEAAHYLQEKIPDESEYGVNAAFRVRRYANDFINFKKRLGKLTPKLTSEQVLTTTFVTLAQTIPAAREAGAPGSESLIDVFIDLFNWNLSSHESNGNIHPHMISFIKGQAGWPREGQANYHFHPNLEQIEKSAIYLVNFRDALQERYLDSIAWEERDREILFNLIIAISSEKDSRFLLEEESQFVAFMLTMFLGVILKDTLVYRKVNKIPQRKSGFFWTAMMLSEWIIRTKIEQV